MALEFPFEKYREAKDVMYCQTQEELEDFLQLLDANGRHWINGDSYLNKTTARKAPIFLFFNKGTLASSLDYCNRRGCRILRCRDFNVEEALPTLGLTFEELMDNSHNGILEGEFSGSM